MQVLTIPTVEQMSWALRRRPLRLTKSNTISAQILHRIRVGSLATMPPIRLVEPTRVASPRSYKPAGRKHWPHASKYRTLMTPLPSIPITKTRLVAIKLRSKGNRSALPQGCVTMTQTARIRTPETRAPMGNACPAAVTAPRGTNAVRTGAVTPLLPLVHLAPSCWIRSTRDSI